MVPKFVVYDKTALKVPYHLVLASALPNCPWLWAEVELNFFDKKFLSNLKEEERPTTMCILTRAAIIGLANGEDDLPDLYDDMWSVEQKQVLRRYSNLIWLAKKFLRAGASLSSKVTSQAMRQSA